MQTNLIKTKSIAVISITALCSTAMNTAIAKDSEPQIPTCSQKLGTLAVTEPKERWWLRHNLESPEAVIKVLVSESKCFTLLDRGKGLKAAQAERSLASSGELQGGSSVGKGQMKAADYVLVPDLVNENSKAGATKIGGMVGGLIGGRAGAAVGGVSIKNKTADVVLTLTDVRSTEQISLQQGHAKKTNIGWRAGGGGIGGLLVAGGASSYSNTEIGQVIAMAYLDAYTKMVNEVKDSTRNAKQENASQAVTMNKPGRMYVAADIKAAVVRDLDVGMMLYPTGEKQGMWWKVSDELGNEGWVPSTLFLLSK